MKYKFSTKPVKCPSCGSDNIADIIYGLPLYSPKLESDLQKGRIVPGGCCVSEDDPDWQCNSCHTEIFRGY